MRRKKIIVTYQQGNDVVHKEFEGNVGYITAPNVLRIWKDNNTLIIPYTSLISLYMES